MDEHIHLVTAHVVDDGLPVRPRIAVLSKHPHVAVRLAAAERAVLRVLLGTLLHGLAVGVGDYEIDGSDARAVLLATRARIVNLEMEGDPVLEDERLFQRPDVTGERNDPY